MKIGSIWIYTSNIVPIDAPVDKNHVQLYEDAESKVNDSII